MTSENVDIEVERARIETNFAGLINTVSKYLEDGSGERTDIITAKNKNDPNRKYSVYELSYDNSSANYDKEIIIDSEVAGRIQISLRSDFGIKILMLDEPHEFNVANFSEGLIPSLINLGKQLEYRRDRDANLEAIRTKYLEDAETKVNTVMEEIESNTPEAIAKALEELNK